MALDISDPLVKDQTPRHLLIAYFDFSILRMYLRALSVQEEESFIVEMFVFCDECMKGRRLQSPENPNLPPPELLTTSTRQTQNFKERGLAYTGSSLIFSSSG